MSDDALVRRFLENLEEEKQLTLETIIRAGTAGNDVMNAIHDGVVCRVRLFLKHTAGKSR